MRNTTSLAFLFILFFASSVAFADEPTTNVRVASDDGPINLEARTPDSAWTIVCSGVCDQPLSQGAEYRVNAQGVATSEPFRLLPREDVTLEVRTHHTGRFAAGVVLVSLGSVLLAASTASAVLGFAIAQGGSFLSIPFLFAAAGGGLVGTGALVPGIVLMTHGTTTRVEQATTRGTTFMLPIVSGSF